MLWVAAALLGIAATVTVAWSASQLAATNVGLAGDPLSVTSGLAPASASAPAHPAQKAPVQPRGTARHRPPHTATTSSTTNAPTPLPVTPIPPVTHTGLAPAPVTPSTTIASTPTSTTPAPAGPTAAKHRDDSRGDGSGSSHHGPDD